MAGTRTKKGIMIAAFAWILILAGAAVSYRFLIAPHLRGKLISETGSGNEVAYKQRIAFGIDNFSGYATVRSDQFQKELAIQGIKLDFIDDKAIYLNRIKDLQSGKMQMAVFTVDSLAATSIAINDMPATIVMIIDESKGADAVVAYKQAVPTLQDLNSANASFVLTPDSPSEFLARTLSASFNLSNMASKSIQKVDGADKVLQRMRKSDKTQKIGYVLWEPYVTQALNDENVQVVFNSSKLTGHLLDVIVAERKFLKENPEVVRSVVESYQRGLSSVLKQTGGLVTLVMEDARKQGTTLTKYQAEHLVAGLVWKNTLENYAHFGLVSTNESGNLPNLDRIIKNIENVLISSEAITEQNFLTGKEKSLYYDGTLRSMQASKFRPDTAQSNILQAATGEVKLDSIRALSQLRPLTEEEWKTLTVVGEFRIEPIIFGRGKSTLNPQSQRDLDEIANRLLNFPNYYLIVVGNARSDGDQDIATQLAQDRSTTAVKYLNKVGVHEGRIKAITARPSGDSGESQSVTFVVGQLPY